MAESHSDSFDEEPEMELDQEFAPSPRRGGGAGGGGGGAAGGSKRYSLAFELATATPEKSSSRDLLRDLGIDEDEEEGGEGEHELGGGHLGYLDDDEASGSDEDEREEEDGRFLNGKGFGEQLERAEDEGEGDDDATRIEHEFGAATPPLADPSSNFPTTPTPPRRKLASASSYSLSSTYLGESSLHHNQGLSSEFSSSSSAPSKSEDQLEAELELSLSQTCSALAHSLESTSVFLSHLRTHTGAPPPSSSASPSEAKVEDPYTDRQPVLESHATTLLQSMHEASRSLDTSFLELTSLEKELFPKKESTSWSLALSTLDALPSPPPSPSSPTSTTTTSDNPLVDSLSTLRTSTTSLLSTLSSLSEQTQVHQIATADSGRKLRALKGHLSTLTEEMGSVERSERLIREWEETEREKGKGKGGYAEEVREVMGQVGEALERGWRDAGRMLECVA